VGDDRYVLRIPGVLQRIALCYGCVALLVLNTGVRGQSLTAVLLFPRIGTVGAMAAKTSCEGSPSSCGAG